MGGRAVNGRLSLIRMPATVTAGVTGGAQVVVVNRVVDRDTAQGIESLVRHADPGPPVRVVIDISGVREVNGALIGALLRVGRRLAWRNRRLTIVCAEAELRRSLEIAGLEELADVNDRLHRH